MSTIAAVHRAEISASLRQGLALSMGFHLTLAVLLFGVLGALRHPPTAVVGGTDAPPTHNPLPPPGDPPAGGGGRFVFVDPSRFADIREVEDRDQVREDPEIDIAPPATDEGLVKDEGIGIANGTPKGEEIGRSSEDSLPDANEPSFADIEPEVVRRVIPVYPDIARQAGLEGQVWVRVLVDKHGAVRKAEIERSSPAFDEAALEAVRKWTFRPAIASGNPVAVWVRIPIQFRMK